MDEPPEQSGDLRTPFIFVPHGDPEPVEWMADHPGWVKFPATMVPRAGAATDRGENLATAGGEERLPGMIWDFSLPPVPPDYQAPDPYNPLSPAFDPVLSLRRAGHLPDVPGGATEAQWYVPFLEGPLSKPPEGFLPRMMERVPRQSGKEAADDTPSWARGSPRRVGETPDAYARRIMDDR